MDLNYNSLETTIGRLLAKLLRFEFVELLALKRFVFSLIVYLGINFGAFGGVISGAHASLEHISFSCVG